jgi:hypothetical protein
MSRIVSEIVITRTAAKVTEEDGMKTNGASVITKTEGHVVLMIQMIITKGHGKKRKSEYSLFFL